MKTDTTREDMLRAVREKCVEANPDITDECINSRCFLLKCHSPSHMRPIRLSDVLLAIYDNHGGLGTEKRALFGKISYEYWYLKDDDLTEQSDETIQFLYDLLYANS